jgi:hypothetical protein
MDTQTTILIGVAVAAAAIAVIGWMLWRKKRTADLRDQFGPEYDRAVAAAGDSRRAEAGLADRAKRVEKLQLREISAADRDRFAQAWTRVQARFVDDPPGAVSEGDALIQEVMKSRGYPVGDFEQRAADLSVDHAEVVQNYRAAREIAIRNRDGKASTEDLRQALVHDRKLFEELLGVPAPAAETRELAHV